MNPVAIFRRRPIISLVLVAALAGGGAQRIWKAPALHLPEFNAFQVYSYMHSISSRFTRLKERVLGHKETASAEGGEGETEAASEGADDESGEHGEQKIIVTSPKVKDVRIAREYVCQIHSQQHINVCAIEDGYLEKILVKEGQAVKKGDLLFKILPVLYKARWDAEKAEADLAQLEYNYTKKLSEDKVVSTNEVLLLKAKLEKAQAKASLAKAELNFTDVTARFDGIVDRQQQQLGSLVKKEDILTTLSDNSLMWVYFNVPEKDYLEYMKGRSQQKDEEKIDLVLADGTTFQAPGRIATIEAKFNNVTGNIPFRADFPNPNRLLRHGQTGKILLHRTLKDAIVIPQRATFDLLDKRYVYVLDKDDVAHQRLITVAFILDDVFVIEKGLEAGEKIVLEGVREAHDGEKVKEYDFRDPEEALTHQKFHAE